SVRSFAGNKLRVYQKAVLEIINAERGGLAKADRAEVARHLQPTAVRGLDNGRKLSARVVDVGLERGDALFGPILHRLARVVRPGELVEVGRKRPDAFEIRSGNVDLRSRRETRVDQLIEREVGVRLDAAGRAQAGDAAR